MSGPVNSKNGILLIIALSFVIAFFWLAKEKKQLESSVMATAEAPVGSEEYNKRAFLRNCKICHTWGPFGKHKAGPRLWEAAGGPKGAKPGYRYSKAMLNAGGTWNDDDLNSFITNPQKFLPGTKMLFKGLANAKDRAGIISFLRLQGGPDDGRDKKEIPK